MRFIDRQDAAEKLAAELKKQKVDFDVVLALPRGGVVLGMVIAHAFKKPFDLAIPRKIGAPDNEEYAIGAVTEEGSDVWNEAERKRVDPSWLKQAVAQQRAEAKRRRETYLQDRPRVPLSGKNVLIVDDGVATSLTMRAAIADVKRSNPKRVIVAVPVAPPDSVRRLQKDADEVIVLSTPAIFFSIGNFYGTFEQVEDAEVVEMMKRTL